MNATLKRTAGAALALVLTAGLGGCALLSSPPPAQLYRFGVGDEAPPSMGDTPAPLTLSIRRIEFPEASRDDRILGVTGNEAAYIKGARWVTDADQLFDDALRGAFAQRADRVRVLNRREPGTPPLVLQVTVTRFEARYATPGAAPTAVIMARAQLRTTPEREAGAGPIRPEQGRSIEEVFIVEQPSAENRVSAIVAAFDTGVADINRQIVDWSLQPH